MAWTTLKNTVRCCNCKTYYIPYKFICPRCGCKDWTYTKETGEEVSDGRN